MPYYDNRFTHDDYATRTERLINLQGNVASLADELELPTEMVTEASTCYTDWLATLGFQTVEQGEANDAVTLARLRFNELRDHFMLLKRYLNNLLRKNPDYSPSKDEQTGILGTTPRIYGELLDKIAGLQEAMTQNSASGSPIVVKTSALTKLQTLKTAFELALRAIKIEGTEAQQATKVTERKFDEQSQLLRDVFEEAELVWDSDEPRFNLLGCVRPSSVQTGGSSGPVPDAPSGLQLSGETLSWTAVSNATSYGVGLSYDGGTHWEGDINSDTNSSVVPVADIGKLYYRVHARNANGYGDYSGTLEHLFGLDDVDNFEFNEDVFTWNPVEFANGYDIQYSLLGEENWVLVFNGNGTDFSHTPASGSWTYRIRSSYGSVKGDWTEIEVEQV